MPVPDAGPPRPRAQIPKPPVDAAAGRDAEAGRAAGLQAGRPGRDARGVRHRARQARRRRSARRGARRRREELDLQRRFEKAHPDRFYQNFIAEQVMVGAAMGLAARGAIPFPSTFACFLSRAADFIRMAAISNVGIKLAGSHAGVSIGEDGPSQMALEDLAMCRAAAELSRCSIRATRSAPSGCRADGLSSRARPTSARAVRRRRSSTRTTRRSPIGGLKVLRESGDDVATVVGAGVTVFEALKAYDELKAGGHADSRHRSLFGRAGRSRRARRRRRARPADA